jgi:hypothetical protein
MSQFPTDMAGWQKFWQEGAAKDEQMRKFNSELNRRIANEVESQLEPVLERLAALEAKLGSPRST